MGVAGVALLFGWGLAEATVFFIVADVAVSWIALQRGSAAGLAAALAAATGALLGIALLYGWASRESDAALALVDNVPWVSTALIEGMRADLGARGWMAVIAAGASGVPIKIAAALAPGLGIAPATFLLVGAAQRLLRFAAVALIAAAVGQWMRGHVPARTVSMIWAAAWTAFYALYWTLLV